MGKNLSQTLQRVFKFPNGKPATRFLFASSIYICFAIHLYQPYFKNFGTLQILLLSNSCIAATGAYLLSRRWVGDFLGSFLSGLVYGFGPFLLSFAVFHPTAGFLPTIMPWLFLPAAFWARGDRKWLAWPLTIFPFFAVPVFFKVCESFKLFAMPIQMKLIARDLVGLVSPLAFLNKSPVYLGFYHVTMAALVMGLLILFNRKRFGLLTIFILPAALCFVEPIYSISPIAWMVFAILFGSMLIGLGTQGLISANIGDKVWILICEIALAGFAIASLAVAVKCANAALNLGNKYVNPLTQAATMYVVAMVVIGAIYFFVRAKLRVHWVRWLMFGAAALVDIFFGARTIVDKIF